MVGNRGSKINSIPAIFIRLQPQVYRKKHALGPDKEKRSPKHHASGEDRTPGASIATTPVLPG